METLIKMGTSMKMKFFSRKKKRKIETLIDRIVAASVEDDSTLGSSFAPWSIHFSSLSAACATFTLDSRALTTFLNRISSSLNEKTLEPLMDLKIKPLYSKKKQIKNTLDLTIGSLPSFISSFVSMCYQRWKAEREECEEE